MEDILLPPDILAELAALEEPQAEPGARATTPADLEKLARIGLALDAKRKQAVEHRRNSGIEDVWTKAEEAYIGIDDANRGEFVHAKWVKPLTMDGPVTTGESRPRVNEEVRSTAFVRLTARYVDAGTAKLCEILFPPDDKAFSLSPTPSPDLIAAKDDQRQVMKDGVLLERDQTPDEAQQAQMQAASSPLASPSMGPPPAQAAPALPSAPGAPPAIDPATGQPAPALPPGKPLTVADLAKEQLQQAEAAAQKAEQRIWDWMVETNYTGEMRKVVFDACRLGVGVLKAPFPTRQKAMALTQVDGAVQLTVQEKIVPGAKWIDPWNFFPHPACGEHIHHGDGCWERAHLSARQLRALKGQKGYLDSQIDQVLEEGPSKRYLTHDKPTQPDLEERFEVWYYTGTLDREDLRVINPDVADGDAKKEEEVFAVCTLVNDHVIKGVLNPLDSGELPYHAFPYQRRADSWAGIGIPEQVAMPQRMVNAATRALLNNAGKSGGAQIVIDRSAVTPADQQWNLTGGDKIWLKAPDCDDVRKAFATFDFPNHTEKYLLINDYGFRLAEESTSIPLITQGQSGKTTPDTYGAAQLQDNNANQLLRTIGYAFDDYVTEPVVKQYYEWLLLDPDVPDEEKGDFQIHAHGSISLVERHIQDQTIAELGQLVTNPVFKIDPKKWFEEYLRTKRLDPTRFQYTPEEQAKIDQTPPPSAPQVEAAKIRAQVDLERAKIDSDRDTQYVQAETERTQVERELKGRELEMKLQLAMLDYSNQRGIALEQVKSSLAETAMKLRVQKEISAQTAVLGLHKETIKPPTEPAGRAPDGQSFQR